LIDHSVTGFISENLDEMVGQVAQLGAIDRRRCRQVFDERFTAQRMTNDYVKLYQQLVSESAALPGTSEQQLASNL
ncbi:MAG TPA: glycosyltransferase family 4 protein, partial [Nitrospira sp.]|nr:glycosyltransferase family 4 protein [Nitrospira sp.]